MTTDAALVDTWAVPLLVTLEARGCRLTVTADGGQLIVEPASWLTVEERERVRAHRAALATLVRFCDESVQARRGAFAAQLGATRAPRVPAFLFRTDVAYRRAVCFSCGERLPTVQFGRCWRCSLAWRLACGLPASAELGAAYDTARMCA